MAQKYDSLLRQHRVDENDDRMGEGPAGGEVRVDGEGLWRGRMWTGKDLDKLDKGKVAHDLRPDHCGYLHRDGNVVVDDLGLKLVRIPR